MQANQAKRSEQEFIDYMVASVMPPSIAEQLLLRDSDVADKKAYGSDDKSKTKLIFRPFTMDRQVQNFKSKIILHFHVPFLSKP